MHSRDDQGQVAESHDANIDLIECNAYAFGMVECSAYGASTSTHSVQDVNHDYETISLRDFPPPPSPLTSNSILPDDQVSIFFVVYMLSYI